jgi:delta24-sterol reductase
MQAPVSSTNGLKPPSARMKFIEKHRAGLVCIGVLPTSCILSGLEKLKRWLTKPAPKDHDARVEAVCFSVKRWAGTDAATRRPMCTDRSSANSHSVRLVDKSAWHRIPMGGLRAILGVETSASGSTVRVEPGVSVGEVTAYLLARKLQLECTLEMEDATLGGLAAATGMTTHSHICGLIHDTIVAWEVVTAAGERVVATADNEHADTLIIITELLIIIR